MSNVEEVLRVVSAPAPDWCGEFGRWQKEDGVQCSGDFIHPPWAKDNLINWRSRAVIAVTRHITGDGLLLVPFFLMWRGGWKNKHDPDSHWGKKVIKSWKNLYRELVGPTTLKLTFTVALVSLAPSLSLVFCSPECQAIWQQSSKDFYPHEILINQFQKQIAASHSLLSKP